MKIMVVLLLMLITNFTTAQTPNIQFNIAKIDGTLVVNCINKETIQFYNSLINTSYYNHNINSKYTYIKTHKTHKQHNTTNYDMFNILTNKLQYV